MIEFKYMIKRKEGNGVRLFTPDKIRSPIPNISVISAPNSSGKSTLMNLIALSLFGIEAENESVNPSLKGRLKSLLNHETQELTFNIKITDDSGKNGFIIIKEKFDTDDIIRKEISNGKEIFIASSGFFKRYELIYDIPDEPLERLKNLIGMVKKQQNNWREEIEGLRRFLESTITDLLRREKQYNIKEIEDKITRNEESKKAIAINNKTLNERSIKLKKYYSLRKYKEKLLEYNRAVDQNKKIKNENRKTSEQAKELNRQLLDLLEQSREIIENIKDLKENIIQSSDIDVISGIKGYRDWVSKKIQSPTIKSVEIDLQIIDRLKENVEAKLSKFDDKNKFEEIAFYEKLSEWIAENLQFDYKVPGTEMTFQRFIQEINGIVKSNSENIEQKKRYDNIIEWSDELIEKIGKYKELQIRISREHKNVNDAQINKMSEELVQNSREMASNVKVMKHELDNLKEDLRRNNIDFENVEVTYSSLLNKFPELNAYNAKDLNAIDRELIGINTRISENDKEKTRIDTSLNILQDQLEMAKKIGHQKYDEKRNELEAIRSLVLDMNRKLSEWTNLIRRYDENDYKSSLGFNDASAKEYFDKVSKYLANKMINVIHIGENYELERVDLLNSNFVTKSGKIIQFDVMGAGESQLAYLKSKLSYKNKILIAMFDEVSTMTPTTMHKIISEMKKLKQNNRLLAGILAFPSDEVRIEE